ncbi:zinc finger protein MAGPIE-like, partial [Trifolium medium]|nr:zinc finger protein MAGPIE-like [Trifolium medium]
KTVTDDGGGGGGGGGGNEGLTRDFLGLRPLSHSDILSIAGIGNCMNDESQKPSWQG